MKKPFLFLLVIVLSLGLILSACAPQNNTENESDTTNETNTTSEEVEETESEEVGEETEVEEAESEEVEEAETSETDSLVGGTLVWALTTEPGTLDPSKASMAVEDTVMQFTGGGLVYPALDGSGYVPYLAESWTISEDGLIWEFKLREDVYFQNGDIMTAEDYAWTFQRALDPEIGSPAAGPMLGNVDSIEAADEFTLRITLVEPNFPILYMLADSGYMQPICKAAFEEMGEEAYARNPVSVGPYSVKEWVTGQKIVLERNPDYNWGPASAENTGPYNIEFIEFRIIPEYATIIAGMESGEIHFAYTTYQPTDIQNLEALDMFEIFTAPQQGIRPYVTLNVSQAPFDDVNVRQAMNLAVDRESLIQIAVQGNGTIQYGPISSAVMGYWAGVEDIGYNYDLEAAKALMEESGYTLNENGIFQKGDLVMSFDYITTPDDTQLKVAQVLKEQYQELGVEINIQTMELGSLLGPLMTGEYLIGSLGMSHGEADLMHIMFHSVNVGAYNFSQLADETLDEILDRTRTETDPELRQLACDEAQQYIVEQAYVIPLYTPLNFIPVSKAVKGIKYNEILMTLEMDAAYFE